MRTSPLRVAIQGERGAFSEQAARRLLGEDARIVPRPTFESMFRAIDERVADCALAPVENSLAGTVHRVYDLLLASRLTISNEVIQPIVHCLIGCPGSTMATIRAVESHPVALAQCERFFARRPGIRRMSTEDTAASVREVIASGDKTRAAIASALAAEIYGGKILMRHVEDHRENYTRFVLLENAARREKKAGNKLSVVFRLPHRSGALHQALGVPARHGLNLTKIESRPLHGKPWEYCFYVDLAISSGGDQFETALGELRRATHGLRILGRYAPARAGKRAQRNARRR